MLTPGAIFLSPEGYETAKGLWVGIFHRSTVIVNPTKI